MIFKFCDVEDRQYALSVLSDSNVLFRVIQDGVEVDELWETEAINLLDVAEIDYRMIDDGRVEGDDEYEEYDEESDESYDADESDEEEDYGENVDEGEFDPGEFLD